MDAYKDDIYSSKCVKEAQMWWVCPGKTPSIFRNFAQSHRRPILDYIWADGEESDDSSGGRGPEYRGNYFERRFRMPEHVFLRIFSATIAESDYLRTGLRQNCTGKYDASPLIKVVSAIRYPACACPADSLGESSVLVDQLIYCP